MSVNFIHKKMSIHVPAFRGLEKLQYLPYFCTKLKMPFFFSKRLPWQHIFFYSKPSETLSWRFAAKEFKSKKMLFLLCFTGARLSEIAKNGSFPGFLFLSIFFTPIDCEKHFFGTRSCRSTLSIKKCRDPCSSMSRVRKMTISSLFLYKTKKLPYSCEY